MNGLLPAGDPRGERVFHEFQRLLLDVGEGRLVQIAHHVGRYAENARDFVDLEFAGFEELRLLRRNGDGLVAHSLFEDGDTVGVFAALINGVPGIAHALGVFHHARMLQHAARLRAVLIKGRAVFVAGEAHADGLLRHGDGTVADKAVKAQTGNMKNVLRRKDHRGLSAQTLHVRIRAGVFVIDVSAGIPIHSHAIGHQRIQRNDLAALIAHDLRIAVAPEQQMRHEGFPEGKGGHFRVRLVVEQVIQRMPQRLFLAARGVVLIEMQRQRGDGLGQNPHTGVHRRHLHGAALVDSFARHSIAEQEGIAAAVQRVARLVPRSE